MTRVGYISLALALVAALSRGQELSWQQEQQARWAPLEFSGKEEPGFTPMPGDQTGVRFSNTVTEEEAAANRVLLNGSGVATGDFNNDGWPDIYFCSLNGQNTLYENRGGWRFSDVTAEARLPRENGYFRAAVFADINGDGWLDLLVSGVGRGVHCFLNDGQGKFSDATTMARTASSFGAMTLSLADVDGNGTLDLYVTNNRAEDIRDRGQVNLHLVNGQMRVPPALKDRLLIADGEVLEYGEPDQLFLNDGRGRFTPISWTGGRFRDAAGRPLAGPPLDWGLAVTFRDINDDGFPDFYVCNDFWTPDRLWLNDGKGRFQEAPALTLRNTSASSMGVDFADIDQDGKLDFFVVDMLSRDLALRKRQKLAQPPSGSPVGAIENRPQFMRNTLFVNRGDGTFAELANYAGLAASEWSWSPVFLDVDLDGYADLLIASGHARDVQDLDAAAQIRARQHPWTGFANEAERQKAYQQELQEHMRLYPPLDSPIVAFRNRGGLRFEDVTQSWGTDQPAIHHSIALADFDQDGDLDMVVNNLESRAGLYRNDTVAPRLAVRLRGQPQNTQGIGAKVRLLGGALPVQSQEVVSGGRYLAGSDPLLVFGVGTRTNPMTLEVVWRSGRQTRIQGVRANRVYEIDEANTAMVPGESKTTVVARPPLFTDISQRLAHTHYQEPFDDFQRQPLLPRRLSQLGPGVSWFDIDRDGREELIIGTSRGGTLALYRNHGTGSFEKINLPPFQKVMARDLTTVLGLRPAKGPPRLLAGASNYQDGSAKTSSVIQFDLAGQSVDDSVSGHGATTGPLALADLAGDGTLSLFVGGRVVPGRYPQAASSRLVRFDGQQFHPDPANSQALSEAGLVSGAVFSDLNGDGLPELILACEWGPLKIFRNHRGSLAEWDPSVQLHSEDARTSLSQLTGWWNAVTTGDFDGDGRQDIVAANWGLNSDRAASAQRPLQLYYGDFLQRGVVDLLEAEWDSSIMAYAPRARLDLLGQAWPELLERFGSHRDYSRATALEALGPNKTRAAKLEATTLASMVFLNREDHFQAVPLPPEAQWAPAFGLCVADFDGDGHEDLFLSQNFFATPAETPRLDAGRGLLLRGDGNGKLAALDGSLSGIKIYGEQRGCATADFDADGRVDLVVTQNGAATSLFNNQGATPGLRVRLVGPPGNVDGIGSTLRLVYESRQGPAREIRAGSGYWSQDSAIQVLGGPEAPTHLTVRWPGGATSKIAVPPGATELWVTNTVSGLR